MSKSKKTEEPKIVADEVYSEILEKHLGSGNLSIWGEQFSTGIYKRMLSKFHILIKEAKRDGITKEDVVELLKKEFKQNFEYVIKAYDNSLEVKDELYNETYKRLKALADKKDITYGELLGEFYSNEGYQNEIFVRLVEEQEGVEITSAKQLQELTGITELYNYWDKDRGFLSDEEAQALAKEQKKPLKSYKATDKQSRDEANREMEETFTRAMLHRYSTTLERMLQAGAKYKDLLQILPSQFNLPDTWTIGLSKDQYSTILWAIFFVFLVDGPPADLMTLPSLRSIALEIEAPYSVLMDSYKNRN